jgi:glycosyltransferase involved in cell wall biosynthesis
VSSTISACLVVCNEEDLIERCLASVADVVDDVVVVHDGPCADRTLQIAERHGCRVFVREQGGYPEYHRPFAYAQARGEWVLKLDADEFLSAPMRARLRELAADPAVNGYAFRWRPWNGHRYITRDGPYKLVLFRKRATHQIGVLHIPERVDGEVREVPVDLEHRPRQAFVLTTLATKWRVWARVQARLYFVELERLPRWNYPGHIAWSRRRRLANRLAPLLIVPAALHTLGFVLWRERHHMSLGERMRFGLVAALNRGMVTAYVAWFSLRGAPDQPGSSQST